MKNLEKEKKITKKKSFNDFLNKYVLVSLQKIAGNIYLRSLMEGFYVTLPIIIFSSLVGIIMWVPPAFAGNTNLYPLEVRMFLNRLYIFTMGVVSLWFVFGISYSFAQKLNQRLPVNRQINIIMVGFASASALFMMSVGGIFALGANGSPTENYASIFISNLGSTGMLTGIIIGLTLPWLFYFPVKYNWTIRLPKVVPQGVSQSFADIIPYGLAVIVYWLFGYAFIQFLGMTFTDALFNAIKPIFSGLDSYGFLAATAFLTSLIWFIGVHGPSVTRPFLTPFMYSNLADNQSAFAQGLHPHWALTYEFSYDFSSTLGGTGATFVIPIILILFTKSKQLKAVGFASYIPIWFQVNEPALFGVPLILNPIAFLPFTIIPIINMELYKFFIDVVGMNGAIADVPWSIPAILGLELGTGIQGWQPALLWITLCTVDFFLWLPFIVVFDRIVCKEELTKAETEKLPMPLHYNYWSVFQSWFISKIGFSKDMKAKYLLSYQNIRTDINRVRTEKRNEKKLLKVNANSTDNSEKLIQEPLVTNKSETKKQYHVLIICYGSGTSALFAQSARQGAILKNIDNITFDSASYGNHKTLMKNMDLIVLAPQLAVYMDEILRDSKEYNVKIVETKGKQYISYTNSSQLAIEFILDQLQNK